MINPLERLADRSVASPAPPLDRSLARLLHRSAARPIARSLDLRSSAHSFRRSIVRSVRRSLAYTNPSSAPLPHPSVCAAKQSDGKQRDQDTQVPIQTLKRKLKDLQTQRRQSQITQSQRPKAKPSQQKETIAGGTTTLQRQIIAPTSKTDRAPCAQCRTQKSLSSFAGKQLKKNKGSLLYCTDCMTKWHIDDGEHSSKQKEEKL